MKGGARAQADGIGAGKQGARRLSRETRTGAILEAARAVFVEKGYEAASTAEIAQRAGVVEGTIYRYFETKLDLFIKVIEEWYSQMLSDFDARLSGVRGTWNRLRFIVWWQLHVVHRDPAMARLVYEQLRYRKEYKKTRVFQLQREYTRRTVGTLLTAIKSGELLPSVKLSVVRDMIHGGVEHSTFAYMRGEGKLKPDEIADNIAGLVYRGLCGVTEEKPRELGAVVADLERITKRLERLSHPSNRDP